MTRPQLTSEDLLLGVDIGGTQIKAASVDESGSIVQSRRVNTPASLSEFRQAVISVLQELIPPTGVRALGIGCKGIINPETSRVDALPGTLHYLEGHLLSEILAPALPARTMIVADNDARVALAGEIAWGTARTYRNALMLTLGTGVGGAVLVDGRILRGSTGAAGHIGHLTIDPDGVLCICGNRGCLETVFSARAIESEAFSAMHRGGIGTEQVPRNAVIRDESPGSALLLHRPVAACRSGRHCVVDTGCAGGQIESRGGPPQRLRLLQSSRGLAAVRFKRQGGGSDDS